MPWISVHITHPRSVYVLSVQPSVKYLEELEGCAGVKEVARARMRLPVLHGVLCD